MRADNPFEREVVSVRNANQQLAGPLEDLATGASTDSGGMTWGLPQSAFQTQSPTPGTAVAPAADTGFSWGNLFGGLTQSAIKVGAGVATAELTKPKAEKLTLAQQMAQLLTAKASAPQTTVIQAPTKTIPTALIIAGVAMAGFAGFMLMRKSGGGGSRRRR
jgi:hypothetical protein